MKTVKKSTAIKYHSLKDTVNEKLYMNDGTENNHNHFKRSRKFSLTPKFFIQFPANHSKIENVNATEVSIRLRMAAMIRQVHKPTKSNNF